MTAVKVERRKAVERKTVKVGKKVAEAVQEYGRLGVDIKTLEVQREAAKEIVLAAIPEGVVGVHDGRDVAKVTHIPGRKVVDLDLLLAAFPEAYDACVSDGEGYPRIYPK
jgi:hypothetical protein